MKAIINGKVFTVTGQTYDKATVLIENGKIKAVGPDVQVPSDAEIIDAAGCWGTPRRRGENPDAGTDRLPYPYLQLQ